MTAALLQRLTRLTESATAAVRLKMQLQQKELWRRAFEQLHIKKVENVEADLQQSLEPLFERQIQSAAKKLRLLAKKKSKAFCPTGPGGGVDPSCGSGGAAKPAGGGGGIPKPPKVPAVLQPKYDEIYAAAKKGDRAAVEAVRTNPNAQSPYPKKLHKYKTDVLAAMDGGGKPATKPEGSFKVEVQTQFWGKPAGDFQKTLANIGIPNATAEQIARASGAISGAEVRIIADASNKWLRVDVNHPEYTAVRNFDDKGLTNANFVTTTTGGGLGTRVFHQQVQEAANLGIKKIHTFAVGDAYQTEFNGYYTWPRLGYDGNIPRAAMQHGDRQKLKQQFPKAKKISDLMRTKAGRDFWKNHGASAFLEFDLSPNSQSRKVLDAYVAAKAGSGTTGGKSAGDDGRRRGDPRRDLGQPRGQRAVEDVMWDGTSSRLADLIFDPSEWNDELINRSLPPLARAMATEMVRALKELGVRVPRELLRAKASTATDWLNSTGIEIDDVTFEVPGSSDVTMGFATEYPQWMKKEIREQLKESFEQDYWAKVNETTLGDIDTFLQTGLRDGWSIREMADAIIPNLIETGKYARRRAKNIARTESGNALNGARVAAADKLIEEIPELPMKKVWLSVLGSTTRREHADLDGVPANKNGEWNLAGIWVRWPGDIRLPPEMRCNCFPAGVAVQGSFVGAQRAWYEGILTEIVTGVGGTIPMTPNHPVMTSRGLVPAGELKPGDKILSYRSKVDADCFFVDSSSSANYVDYKPVEIEKVFQAFFAGSVLSETDVERRVARVDDFYGDGGFIDGEVEIVRADWELLKHRYLLQSKEIRDHILVPVYVGLIPEFGSSGSGLGLITLGNTAACGPGSRQQSSNGIIPIGLVGPSGSLCLGSIAKYNSVLSKTFSEGSTGYPGGLLEVWNALAGKVPIHQSVLCDEGVSVGSLRSGSEYSTSDFYSGFNEEPSESSRVAGDPPCDSLNGSPRQVFFDEVVEVRERAFSGHVYDLESSDGFIIAHDPTHQHTGIVVSNCQCTILVEFGMSDAAAQDLIDDYGERIWEDEEPDEEKTFCPTGPGGGVDPTCGSGGSKPAGLVGINDVPTLKMTKISKISIRIDSKLTGAAAKHAKRIAPGIETQVSAIPDNMRVAGGASANVNIKNRGKNDPTHADAVFIAAGQGFASPAGYLNVFPDKDADPTEAGGTAVHEYGHAVDRWVGVTNKVGSGWVSEHPGFRAAFDADRIKWEGKAENRYICSNPREMFAEVYSKIAGGNRGDKIDRPTGEFLDGFPNSSAWIRELFAKGVYE